MTILIPALNAARFMPRCISSVLNQTRDDWRIQILIDCATVDNTYRKACYVRNSSKCGRQIHINISERPGLPNVYKELIDRAEPRDDVCGFLDADDRIVPQAVDTILGAYENKPETGHMWSQFSLHPSGGKGWSRRLPPSVSQIEAFSKGWWGSQHWRTFRKSIYCSSKWALQLDVPYATDYNLALVLAATDCPVHFVNRSLYIYYQTKGGITHSSQGRQRQCFNTMHQRFKNWAKKGTACVSSLRKSTG